MTSAINSAGGAALGVAIVLSIVLMWQRFDCEVSTRRFWIVAPLIGVLAVIGVAFLEYAP